MIPFNKAYYTGNELKYMEDSIKRNKISGDGYYTKKLTNSWKNNFSDQEKSSISLQPFLGSAPGVQNFTILQLSESFARIEILSGLSR